MTSPLSPRDIQTRIRSGASLEEVAREAEMPVERVEPFAAPVLAEREHVAGTALQCPVRRRGETGSVRAMRAVVDDKIAPHGLVTDDAEWDAWRNEDRRWTVVGTYTFDEEQHRAEFIFDPRARFSVAANDEARWLIGEFTPQTAEVGSPDAEPTVDLNDELALVRAVQGSVPIVDSPRPGQPEREKQLDVAYTRDEQATSPDQVRSRDEVLDDEETELEDYAPAEFEQVDGVYDFVPKNSSDMDVLYEMLSSFAEDSVNIYAGLANPVTQAPQQADDLESDDDEELPSPVVLRPLPTPGAPSTDSPTASEGGTDPEKSAPKDTLAEVVEIPAVPVVAHTEVVAEVEMPGQQDKQSTTELVEEGSQSAAIDPSATPSSKPSRTPARKRTPRKTTPRKTTKAPVEAAATVEQEAPADEAATPARPKPRPRKKRASVPSWDEIMFGGPTSPSKD